MVSQGSLAPFFTRPVALILLLVIVFTFINNTKMYKQLLNRVLRKKEKQ
jgi:TctA family transporter